MDDDFVTLRSFLEICLKHRGKIIAGFFLAALPSTIFVLTRPPVYEATTTLLVRLGRENIYRPELGDDLRSLANNDRESILNTEVEILLSRDLHESVVKAVGPEKLYPQSGAGPEQPIDLPAAVDKFGNNLRIDGKPEADVIRVSFRHPEPQIMPTVVNLLVDLFKERHLQIFSDPETKNFLGSKVATYRQELDETEEQLKTYRVRHNLISIDDHRALLIRQRRLVDESLKGAQTTAAGLKQKASFLQVLASDKETSSNDNGAPVGGEIGAQSGSETSAGQTADPQIDRALLKQVQPARAVDDANSQLLELELREKELLVGFKESTRQVVKIREQIQIVKAFLAEQEARMRADSQSVLVDSLAELRFQQAIGESLESQVRQLDEELRRLPSLEASLRDLTRARDSAERNYLSYSKRLEDALVSEEMDRQKIANISVIQKAVTPRTPAGPPKKLFLLVSVLLSLSVGLAWALAAHSQIYEKLMAPTPSSARKE